MYTRGETMTENGIKGYYDGCPNWRGWKRENEEWMRYHVFHTPHGIYGIYVEDGNGEPGYELVCLASDYYRWIDATCTGIDTDKAVYKLTEAAMDIGLPETIGTQEWG